METLFALVIVGIGVVAICQFGIRCVAESEKAKLDEDIEQLLAAIEKSKMTGRLSCQAPRDELLRKIYVNYLKLFLQEKEARNIIGHDYTQKP